MGQLCWTLLQELCGAGCCKVAYSLKRSETVPKWLFRVSLPSLQAGVTEAQSTTSWLPGLDSDRGHRTDLDHPTKQHMTSLQGAQDAATAVDSYSSNAGTAGSALTIGTDKTGNSARIGHKRSIASSYNSSPGAGAGSSTAPAMVDPTNRVTIGGSATVDQPPADMPRNGCASVY